MSNHFTYEIDERNIRLQLKELVLPVKEDAWQKFESFSDTMVNEHRENRFKSFHLNLNRSVVLPAVFGVIIILFSFLLVNFISIKNPVKENAQKAEATVNTVAAPQQISQDQPKKHEVKPVPVVKEENIESKTESVTDPKVQEVQIASVVPVNKQENSQVTTPAQSTGEISTSDTMANTEAKTETPVKKKRKRRSEVVEEQLMDIRPTIVAEESDTDEIRPN